jgi:hypothetical protein
MSTTDRKRGPSIIGDDGGAALVDFGFVIPILIILTMGILELTMIAMDYHRASEAARSAVRQASMLGPMAEMDVVEGGGTLTCKYVSGAVYCEGETVTDATIFTAIVTAVRDVIPYATSSNVEVRYEPSGIGDPDSPAGILPLLNLKLVGLRHEFLTMSVLGGLEGGLDLPVIEATMLSSSVDSSKI